MGHATELNIRPLNDFAFRKTFATERNRLALIGLLNAILQPARPIVDVVILDPFNLQDYETEELLRLFPEAEFQQATRSLIEIAEKTRDKMAYDKRELAFRDQRAAITTALEKGRQEGRQDGLREGELRGEIKILRELLDIPKSEPTDLSQYDEAQLTQLAEQLRTQLRTRGRAHS